MNVFKKDFTSKPKRLQDLNHKSLRTFFSNDSTGPITNFSVFDDEKKIQYEENFSPKFCLPSFLEAKIGEKQADEPEKILENTFKTTRNVFAGQSSTDATTSTSEEFHKIMASFQDFRLAANTWNSEDSYSSPFKTSEERAALVLNQLENNFVDQLFKKPREISTKEYDYSMTSQEVQFSPQKKSSSFSNEIPHKRYSIFSLSVPRNQKGIEEVLSGKFGSSCSRSKIMNTSETPIKTHVRDFPSSSSGCKTPKIGKSPKASDSSKLFNSNSGAFILAVTEGRGHARGEVGIAAMDPKRPHIVLCQISDTQRYVHSLTKMNVFSFVEVIVPNTFVDGPTPNKLYCDIRSRFPTVTLTSVQRKHFNEAIGVDLIKQFCSPESTSVMILLRDKFYALSAAAALLKYIEFTQNVHLAPLSLKVEYQGTEDTMIIDLDTANRLELVMCASHPEINFNNSLLGVVKHCHTKGGIRLLRANILQPPCSLAKIQRRLDCVTELVNNPLLLCSLEGAVMSFTNLESLLNLCMHAPQQDGIRVAECQLKYTLLLKTILELLPVLISSLDKAKSDYFCQVQENLRDPRYNMILERILGTIFENARTVKGSVAAHLHGCFAIKTGVNSLLDIAKKTYCEIVQEISDYINKLREAHGLPLRISFSANKGFHIQYTLPPGRRNMKKSELPKEFILVQKSKTTFSFYTSELVALDQRSQHILNEIKLMTNVILFELLTDIRENIGSLYNLCEYIAELDVLISFAQVSSGKNFVRPKFGDELNLKNSKHPILNVIHDGEVVPNNVFAKDDQNFMILTGPNQSGKSIYIRQVALLQILAQIGCYVPAEEATFRMTDRIFSRIGFDDSIESNACTLMVEMRDIEYIKQNLTTKSLVIIDELCRGTSIDEGTTLAFAICEAFIDSTAFIFFTTHYILLTKLEELYYTVNNFHFETVIETRNDKSLVCFTHSKKQGATKAELYGLQVAEVTSFPKDVCLKAREIAKKLCRTRKPRPKIKGLLARYKLSKQLREELLKFTAELEWKKVDSVIRRYKNLYSEITRTNGEDKEDEEIIKLEEEVMKREISSEKTDGKRRRITFRVTEAIKRKYRKIRYQRRRKAQNN